MIAEAYIKDMDTDTQTLTMVTTLDPSLSRLIERQHITQCEVIFRDGREISPTQRNKIFALISDITEYVSGFDKKKMAYNETLRQMQLCYLIDTSTESVRRQLTMNYCMLQSVDIFSLASKTACTIDMTTAYDFIDWLVELCVVHGIPCQDTLLNRCEDIGRYLYACVINRRCCICGGKADIHEYERVGMGRNRKKIHHSGQKVQPLCRKHHCEVDNLGQQSFDNKYNVTWVQLDDIACEKLGWKK